MKRRLVLHIGTPKTGSTTIQHALTQGRDRLLGLGVLYPASERGGDGHPSKHTITSTAARSGEPGACEGERSELMREFDASGCHTMILSEEGLSLPVFPIPDFFRPFLQRLDITVVCCLRRQDHFVESLYSQFTRSDRHRNSMPIGEFWRSDLTRPRLDYHAMLSRWRTASTEIAVIEYDRAVAGDGVVAAFLAAGRIGAVDLEDRVHNPSPDIRVSMMVERMRGLGFASEVRPLVRASRAEAVVERFGRMSRALGSRDRRLLLAEVAASNERLAADFHTTFGTDLPGDEGEEPLLLDSQLDYVLAVLSAVSQNARRPGRNDA